MSDVMLTNDALLAVDQDNIVHSWTAQAAYSPKLIVRAEGCDLWDHTGKRYLDLTSQAWYANIGHGNRTVATAIADQARTLAAVYRLGTEPKLTLASTLLSLLPEGYQRVFFGCNGSDAVEVALKVARLVTGRQQVISFYGEYHGASMGATSITGLTQWRSRVGQPVPGTIFVPPPYAKTDDDGDQARREAQTLAQLDEVIRQSDPATIAAVVGEPFITGGPLMFPTRDYWQRVRALCDSYGILLIADEVVTGFGRCGHWFARDYYDYRPDILCLGKGLTSGYLPLSAAIFSRSVAAQFDTDLLPHGLTYSGHPICCAAALANIQVINDDGLIDRAAALGDVLATHMQSMTQNVPAVARAASLGLFAVIELTGTAGEATRGRDKPSVGKLVMRRAEDEGLLVRGDGQRVYLAPPLIMSTAQLETAIDALSLIIDRTVTTD